ncbi:MAG: DJ-1/PfpI family protein, partial [Pseudomonadota bacterium]
MLLGIPVYDGVNMLDVVGPAEIFYWAGRQSDLEVKLLSADGKPRTSINNITFEAHASFADHPALDVLWVPGGSTDALKRIMSNPASEYLAYLKRTAADAQWVCSVCEGALIAAQAGILDGHDVTTHWAFVECLESYPEVRLAQGNPRYHVSGNRLTGGGISAGIDEALKLVEILFGADVAERVQVTTEYFPDPPVMGKLPTPGP